MSTPKEQEHVIDTEASTSGSSLSLDAKAERRVVRKCDIYLIPSLFVLYMMSFLDRINLGNARIQNLEVDLDMTGFDYNVALLTFFIGYITLEAPSNILLRKMAPSTWLSTLVFCWGVVVIGQGLTRSFAGLVVCRILLGVFEAGFLPGCFYLISMYYRRHEVQLRASAFFASGMFAGAFGGLLAFALAKMDGVGGIFIVEGLITVVLGVLGKFFVADWPESARFLNAEEKAVLLRRLEEDKLVGQKEKIDKATIILALRDWKIWTSAVIYIFLAAPGYGLSYFIPTILRELGYTAAQAQVHSIPIYMAGVPLAILAAWATARFEQRFGVALFGAAMCATGFAILLAQRRRADAVPVGAKYAALFFIIDATYICIPVNVLWLANNLAGPYKRAIGVGVMIGVGNLGGILGSLMFIPSEAPTYVTGYSIGLAGLVLIAVLDCVLYFGMRAENRKRERGERDYRLRQPAEVVECLGDDHPEFRYTL
ncbi:MAG: hypothetical protein M1833_003098 [Piccolia ochrophora]|nr:MAG: hypothetical protein M1833_003098 [Piccolia ochrophora]